MGGSHLTGLEDAWHLTVVLVEGFTYLEASARGVLVSAMNRGGVSNDNTFSGDVDNLA